jgi:alpha-1,2-mannosyltransferase
MDASSIRQLAPSVRQRWLLLGLILVFVGYSIPYAIKASNNRSAYVRWSDQIKDLGKADIYRVYNYPNPPIMPLILKPLTELPLVVGSLVWYALKVGMTLLALYWLFRLVEEQGLPFPDWAKVVTVLLSIRPILGDLSHGNINIFIMFLVVGALYAFRQRWDLTAGLTLGLAIACKVTPALFLPYLVWKRAWKTLAGCAAGLVLFFWVVPGLFLGWQENHELLKSWAENMVKPFVISGDVLYSEHNNQSLPGYLFRMVTHSPSFTEYVDNKVQPVEYHNFLALDPDLAKLLVKLFMASFVALVVWVCRTPTQPRAGWRLAAEYSIIVLGMLLFSERTWKHHCVTLVLPFAVICYYLLAIRPAPLLRGFLIAALALVVLLMASTSDGLLPERTAELAQTYGGYVWAYLVLLAALTGLLYKHQGASDGRRELGADDPVATPARHPALLTRPLTSSARPSPLSGR